ncbi:MarR family transcriptional regulator [Roseovarius sp. SK2]|uniref:MarR family winged helix-turn-helix transcriptional regulator n=1 Tax=Roseovarius TaxID=74030 RepID=UPI00237B83A6|nr:MULTISPECIES: MarR family transcriptional regulator [unclassified Roseovarius]MDD9726765.1 MarR family transcriptional regulator [Roseovarius sp. SK2]
MSRTPQNLSAWQVLSRTHRRLQSHLESALKAEGLPPLDVLDALAALDAGQDGQTAKSLEHSLMLPQYGVSRLLDRVEKDGLIRRVADATDKRLKHVHLTEAGRATLIAMVQTRDAALDAFLAPRAKPGQLDRITDLLSLLDQDASEPTSG